MYTRRDARKNVEAKMRYIGIFLVIFVVLSLSITIIIAPVIIAEYFFGEDVAGVIGLAYILTATSGVATYVIRESEK